MNRHLINRHLHFLAMSSLWLIGCENPLSSNNRSEKRGSQPGAIAIDTSDEEIPRDALAESPQIEETGTQILPSALSIRPDTESDSGLSLSLTGSETDFSKHKVEKFMWDPAQAPLKSMNQLLCILARSGFASQINSDTYIAQITLGDCFRSDDFSAAPTTGQKETPANVTVTTSQSGDNDPIVVKIWFQKKFDDPYAVGGTGGIDGIQNKTNYYVTAEIKEKVSKKNPYGLFSLRWQVFKLDAAGNESSNSLIEGYINVERAANGNISLNYNEKKIQDDNYSCWDSGTNYDIDSQYTTLQQAVANLFIIDGEPSSGIARTASTYSSQIVSTTPANAPCSGGTWQDDSGSYSMAFDLKNGATTSSNYNGRTLTKWIPGGGNSNWSINGSYNPTEQRCEQIGGELPYIWDWDLFDQAGTRIRHETGFPVEVDSANEWAGGWVGRWGTWLYDVEHGDTVFITGNDNIRKPYTVHVFNGTLMDNSSWEDVTLSTSSNLVLDCSSNCPKANITQTDFDNQWDGNSGNDSLYLTGSQVYVFNVADRALYHDPNGDGNIGADGDEVKFNGVSNGSVYINLTKNGTSETFSYDMSSWSLAGYAFDSNTSSYFTAPDPIEFQNRTYTDASDAYPGAENPSVDGQMINTFNNGSNWTFESSWLCCIDWEQKNGIKDSWGYDIYLPTITPQKGFELILANDPDGSGPLNIGQTLKIAPARGEFRSKIKTDCKQSLVDDVNDAASNYSLPEALSAPARNIKSEIGLIPNGSYAIKVVNGRSK